MGSACRGAYAVPHNYAVYAAKVGAALSHSVTNQTLLCCSLPAAHSQAKDSCHLGCKSKVYGVA